MWFPNSDKRFLTSPTRAAKQITVRGAIKKMSQIVEKVHKGGGVKVKVVYISNVD